MVWAITSAPYRHVQHTDHMKLTLCVYRLPQLFCTLQGTNSYLSPKSGSLFRLYPCQGSTMAVSPSYLDHGTIGRPGNLEHASMRSLLAVHCCRDDKTQIVLAGILPHGIPQADLIRPKQAHLHQAWQACRRTQATQIYICRARNADTMAGGFSDKAVCKSESSAAPSQEMCVPDAKLQD